MPPQPLTVGSEVKEFIEKNKHDVHRETVLILWRQQRGREDQITYMYMTYAEAQ